MIRFLAAVLFGTLSLSASADDAKVKAAIQSLVPNATIDSIADAAIPGFYEVVLQGSIVYVSQDGKYLVQGSIFDIANKKDLTETAKASLRKTALAAAPKDQRIIYAPEKTKHVITVFTDIDCGYCRRMHSQMAEYNKLGIEVEYMFFPRSGLGTESYDKAVSVWCSADRNKALTDAKAGQAIDKKECPNPVEKDYALGQKIAVTGTPAVFAPDGTQLGGYLPPDQMLQRLDQLAAASKAP